MSAPTPSQELDRDSTRLGMLGQLQEVCVVHHLRPDPGTVGVTAIDKRPIEGPVKVRTLGLYGDVQADRKNHGGEDKAVYAYSAQDALWWAEELGHDVPAGYFGENLRIIGVDGAVFDVDAALAGEQWRIGAQVILEVTRPRIPCATFGRWVEQDRWVKRFLEAQRPGTYLRVVKTGKIEAGDTVEVISLGHGPTMREVSVTRGPSSARPND